MDAFKSSRFRQAHSPGSEVRKRLSNPGMFLKHRTGFAERARVRAREMDVPVGSVSGAAKAVAMRIPVARIVAVLGLTVLAALGVLIGVNAYAKSRQINVQLENGLMPKKIVTSARTVAELLDQYSIHLGTNDVVQPAMNSRLVDGMTVSVDRAMLVYITSGGQTLEQYMTSGTVAEALARAHITYDPDDEITPSLETKLTPGLRIQHVAVTTEMIKETQYIDYKTTYKDTKSLLKGKTQVQTAGSQGEQTREIKVVYKDGIEISRTEISNNTTKQPVDRVILQGVGVAATAKPPTAGTPKPMTPAELSYDGSKNYGGHYASVKPEDLVVPSVPAKFESVLYMQITAYTHTGRTTARGNWPQYTRTLKKPGTIAVDPKAIPYGTLLYVTGYGYCVAEDTGSNSVDSSKMGDVFMNTIAQCNRWGRQRNVAVYVIQSNFKR